MATSGKYITDSVQVDLVRTKVGDPWRIMNMDEEGVTGMEGVNGQSAVATHGKAT